MKIPTRENNICRNITSYQKNRSASTGYHNNFSFSCMILCEFTRFNCVIITMQSLFLFFEIDFLGTHAINGPIIPGLDERWEKLCIWCNTVREGKPRHLERTYPNVTVSTADPTSTEQTLNLGGCCKKPVNNGLNCSTTNHHACVTLSSVAHL
jgi:hypothetical protein